ncbi:hypothetical protein AZL_e02090 (plasmid) [Azospirillum sp. B510]|uniref:hypothetical protein n=1 Tax=Azospirillum sp. (strain B510) TaxID=137722 RepID=UPI0001C4CE40|nr:hypothetical protein [Azospirillum sp. B510]BAI76554.1 hypothetical protein AZL_e02090 [Azospirillum sp. B510]
MKFGSALSALMTLGLLCGTAGGQALAQALVEDEPIDRSIGWGTWLYESAADRYGNAMDSAGMVWWSVSRILTPINPFGGETHDETGRALTPADRAARDRSRREEFVQIGQDAGFELVCTVSGIGLPPQLTYSFQNIRELTEADAIAVRRRLDGFRQTYSGFPARVDGLVLEAIVKAGTYADQTGATAVIVSLLPIPTVTLVAVSPAQVAQTGPICGGAS